MTKFSGHTTVGDTARQVSEWTHARMPVYSDDNPDTWSGFVLRRDLLTQLAEGSPDTTLESLSRPIHSVADSTRANELLKSFVARQTHLFAVHDEFGNILGVVSLEDVIEELIGQEIVDELDTAVDMRKVARLRAEKSQSEVDGPSAS